MKSRHQQGEERSATIISLNHEEKNPWGGDKKTTKTTNRKLKVNLQDWI